MVRRKSTKSSVTTRSSKRSRSTGTEVLVSKQRNKYRHLQEIKYLQRTTKLLMPKAPFARLVKEIIFEMFPKSDVNRIQSLALEALQESCEMYLVHFFEDAMLIAIHAKRVTLMRPDMILLRRLKGREDVINK